MATHLDWIIGIFITAVHIAIMCVSAQNSLSAEDKQELLDAHNMFRGMVSPPATNMLRMVSHKWISFLIFFTCILVNADQKYILFHILFSQPLACTESLGLKFITQISFCLPLIIHILHALTTCTHTHTHIHVHTCIHTHTMYTGVE